MHDGVFEVSGDIVGECLFVSFEYTHVHTAHYIGCSADRTCAFIFAIFLECFSAGDIESGRGRSSRDSAESFDVWSIGFGFFEQFGNCVYEVFFS